MNGERLRIVRALSEFRDSVGINELVERSELSRGKVLGNLTRLCREGLVEKNGKQYVITNRAKAINGELNQVPQDKGFYFCFAENKYTGQTALSLKDFYKIVKTIDVQSLEFHNRRGDFGNWIRDILHDDELASEVNALKDENISGEVLRNKLDDTVGRNYRMMTMLTA